jgi:hypothetical protein
VVFEKVLAMVLSLNPQDCSLDIELDDKNLVARKVSDGVLGLMVISPLSWTGRL